MELWTAESILNAARQFTQSRVLLTAAELDVFTPLARESLTFEEVAARVGGDLRGIRILLDALAGMGLLVKENARYRCEGEVAAALSSDSPTSVRPMLMHSNALWGRWSLLTEIARGARPSGNPLTAAHRPEEREAFIGAMHAVSQGRAPAVVEAVQPGAARHLVDVGGASGTYTEAFLRACPEMRATIFDLPPVVEMARKRLTPTGLLSRITLVAGDFLVDPIPGGHDLALLSAIIHQNSPEQNLALYRNCFGGLVPGGRIVVRDHILDETRTQPPAGALFAVNMLTATDGGDCYTFDEIRQGLEAAGFVRVKQIAEDEQMSGLVEAFRP